MNGSNGKEDKSGEKKMENERLTAAEVSIRKEQYEAAVSELKELIKEEPDNGRIAFDLGNIALLQGDSKLAMQYYETAEQKDYQSCGLYQNMAAVMEQKGLWKQAERFYLKALELAEEDIEGGMILSAQTQCYLRGHMFLKAEKTAKQLMKTFPEEYQGHHLYYLAQVGRQQTDVWEKHFAEIEEIFAEHPQYWIDRLSGLELSGNAEEVARLLYEEPKVLQLIPRIALRKRVQLSLKEGKQEEGKLDICVLMEQYKDGGAAFATMILEMMEGNYLRAGALSNAIMEAHKAALDEIFYMTMYLQIFILYLAEEGNPDEDIRNLMEEEAKLCMEWMEKNGASVNEMKESLKLIHIEC